MTNTVESLRNGKEEIKYLARKAEELYNRYRAPEAVAKVVTVGDDKIAVEFYGTFCETCGLYDWIEDMKYVLKDLLKTNVDLVEVIEDSNKPNSYIGIFRLQLGRRGIQRSKYK